MFLWESNSGPLFDLYGDINSVSAENGLLSRELMLFDDSEQWIGQYAKVLNFITDDPILNLKENNSTKICPTSICESLPNHFIDFGTLSECDIIIASSSTFTVAAGFTGKKDKKIIE